MPWGSAPRLTRRALVRSGAAAGALLLAQPGGLGASALAAPDTRRSRLARDGTFLVHADLHNHSLFSDGAGDPQLAFQSMRAAGLDVAALTDHSTVSYGLPVSPCGDDLGCQKLAGITEATWQRSRELADRAQADGEFTALRGFEWSSPTLGHMNVWLSERWTDPLHTGAVGTGEGAAGFIDGRSPFPLNDATVPLDALIQASPTTGVSMRPFQEWLAASPERPVLGGGADGLAGFNHPGREPGRFSYFSYDGALRERVVSLEIFNRGEDYLFEGTDSGAESPLSQCLAAGWRVGLLGVSDEHGTSWGTRDGRGRAAVWVTALTRDGVREALRARRFAATVVNGLRLDATANRVRMGSTLVHAGGKVRFRLDLTRGPAWEGRPVVVQVLATPRSGQRLPRVLAVARTTYPRRGKLLSFSLPVDPATTPWLVLRVSDPSVAPDARTTGLYAQLGAAVAYASPFYLEPSGGNEISAPELLDPDIDVAVPVDLLEP